MDKSLRAQIISISLFVSRHSSTIMRGEDDFEALIDINKMVMQGLATEEQAANETIRLATRGNDGSSPRAYWVRTRFRTASIGTAPHSASRPDRTRAAAC